VSAVATSHPRTSAYDRLLAAVPLASVYIWLAMIYAVEAWKRNTPWLFTVELVFTQLSRSFAETGRAARRGEPHSIGSLYNVLTAPFWRIDDVAAAFAAIKYFDVLVMAAVVFPTYFLARLVVGRRYALFAAAAAAAIPAMAYSSWIVEETLAYPYSTLCLFLIAKALLVRSRGWFVAAAIASLLAPAVRVELVVIPVTFLLAVFLMAWSSDAFRRIRSSWSLGDWLGVVALAFGVVYLVSGIGSHLSSGWYSVTTYWKGRIFQYGDWATGALAVGAGVVPAIVGPAALAPMSRRDTSPELRVFRSLAVSALASFWFYTGMKGAYLSTVFESRVVERNLIYIAPLLFIGTALALERRRIRLWAAAAAGLYVGYVVLTTPLFVGGGFYSDAPGLAIFQQANRYFYLNATHARLILVGLLVLTAAVVVVLPRARQRAAAALAASLAVGIVAWNLTGEVAAAAGSVTVARDLTPALSEPFTWVDDVTRLKPTLYLGQMVSDQNPVWLLEFWNRSIKTVSSLDGSISGPGPAGAPNITPAGKLYWTVDPSDVGKTFDYAVEDWPCIDFAGTRVATHRYRGGAAGLRQWRLVQLTKPNRLRALCIGVYPDGWSGEDDSRYFRFTASEPGWLRITLSRSGFRPSDVDVQLGTIAREHNQPVLGKVTRHLRARVETDERTVIWVRTPAHPFAIRTVVEDKIVPSEVDPNSGDIRTLGALISYRFSTKR
jgi:hypothetical protein